MQMLPDVDPAEVEGGEAANNWQAEEQAATGRPRRGELKELGDI